MRKTHIFRDNKYVESFNCDGKRHISKQPIMKQISFFFKKWLMILFKVNLIAWLFVGGIHIGQNVLPPQVVLAEKEVVKIQKIKFEDIPMLVKICNAESGGKQFNKNGDVLRGKVNPSDIGFCQINEYINNDEARRLGYDIYTEQGNKDYAIYLYLTRGTAPWNSSRAVWSK